MKRRVPLIVGAALMAVLIWQALKPETAAMTTFEDHPMCQILTTDAFSAQARQLLSQTMVQPVDGMPLELEIAFGLPVSDADTLILTLGTTYGVSDVEYLGPPRATIALRIPLEPQETSVPIFPTVTLIHPERQAICVWATAEGRDLTAPSRWALRLRTEPAASRGPQDERMQSGLTLTPL